MHRYPKNYDYYGNALLAEKCFDSFLPNFTPFAGAGFYFSRGFLYCCACSLRLTDWMSIKNLIITHCILNPHCPFLLKEKGSLFIYNVKQTYIKDWSADMLVCLICYSRYIDNFVSCGHMYCSCCLQKLKSCPFCKHSITYHATNSTGLQYF